MGNDTKKCVSICVANNKGGVGKTTACSALAYLLSKKDKKVLLIDADPQGNLSSRFGFNAQKQSPNYIGALIQDRMRQNDHKPVTEYINKLYNHVDIDIIISDLRLDSDYQELSTDTIASATLFKELISEIEALNIYDYIMIDTRPALSSAVSTVFAAVDYVLIPIDAGMDSIVGANSMMAFMAKCRKLNPGLSLLGVFFNRVQNRSLTFKEAQPFVKEGWKDRLFETIIPHTQNAVKAENEGKPVTQMFSSEKITKAYKSLLDEMEARLNA